MRPTRSGLLTAGRRDVSVLLDLESVFADGNADFRPFSDILVCQISDTVSYTSLNAGHGGRERS